jgi:hypothetical protein
MIMAHARDTKTSYKVLLVMRPDLEFLDPIPAAELTQLLKLGAKVVVNLPFDVVGCSFDEGVKLAANMTKVVGLHRLN